MLDDIGSVTQSPLREDWGLNQVRDWHLQFCYLPRSCFLTGKRLWWRWCYTGSRVINGPGTPVQAVYYIEKDEFIFWRLRGNHGIV